MAKEEEKIHSLLVTLKGIGFEGEDVEDKVRQLFFLKLPCPVLRLRKGFGSESLLIELQLGGNLITGDIVITHYLAIYRMPIHITPSVENGVDIAALELRMQQVDWKLYNRWHNEWLGIDTEISQYMLETVALLNRLAETLIGIDYCNLLLYKYTPDYFDSTQAIAALRSTYERLKEFPVDGDHFCHVNLAYHLLSDRVDDLEEAIKDLIGNVNVPYNLRDSLEDQLSHDPDSFTLDLSFQRQDAMARAIIPVFKRDGYYQLDGYNLTVTTYPQFNHNCFNGVDTGDLEQLMQRIDFQFGLVFPRHHDGERLYKDWTTEMEEELNRLWQDKQGMLIACVLVHRYIQDEPYFISKIPAEAIEIIEKFQSLAYDFNNDISIATACNLLEGRWVPKEFVDPLDPQTNVWVRMTFLEGPGKVMNFEEVEGPDQGELKRLLGFLPFKGYLAIDKACDALLKGEIAKLSSPEGNELSIVNAPDKNTLLVYNNKGQLIPINLHLDPDWKPDPTQDTVNSQKSITNKGNKQLPKNPGKGL